MAESIKFNGDKYLDASGVWYDGKTLDKLVPKFIHTQNPFSFVEQNCKELCSIMTPDLPQMFVVQNGGKGLYIGYTYEKSNNPSYAQFFGLLVEQNIIFVASCKNHTWTITTH